MKRAEILEQARKCVCGEREREYGRPENNFALIGKLWEAYTGMRYSAKDVAMMLALLKVARIKTGVKGDSFVDLAGYAACAGEIATETPKVPPVNTCMEEMSELTKELSKNLRGADNAKALAEEIADVEIMLEQLKVIFRNRALVDRIRAGKLVRLSDRITGEARE